MAESVKFEIHFDFHESHEKTEPKTETIPAKPKPKKRTKKDIMRGGGMPQDLEEQIPFHQTSVGGAVDPEHPVEPKQIGFQKAKQIRGGVMKSKFRDERSSQAVVLQKYYIKLEQLERDIAMLKHMNKFSDTFSQVTGQISDKTKMLTNPQQAATEFVTQIFQKAETKRLEMMPSKGALGNRQAQQRGIAQTMLSMAAGAGPYGIAFIAAITAIVAAPEVVAKIVKVLSQKGLPLNMDWKRVIEDEVNGIMTIEEKKRRLLGLDTFISTQSNRYQADSGSPTYNSYENRDEIRIATAGQRSKALGIQ